MYQWRKFEFFEEKSAGKYSIPAEIEGKVQCCSSGRGRITIGCDDGTVGFLDRSFKLSYAFQAHAASVMFLQQLKQRNFLVTVGEDERTSPQISPICLKVFDLDKMEPEGSSTTTPICIQILRIFTNQFPEAKITSFLVLEEASPVLLISIGLDNGSIYCIRGDIARERITRFKLDVEVASDKSICPITGLGFHAEGKSPQLFAVTPFSVSLFNMQDQPPKVQTLDHIGCDLNAVSMNDRLDLIIGRPEAVYFYEADGRGPCWAFEGEKKLLGWFRSYLLCVIRDRRSGKNTFNVYDLKNRLIAHSMIVGDVSHLISEWGNIVLIMSDKKIICVGEKDMESKLDMLFKKNLYTVAVNLVQSQQADAAATAQVLRKYGDHLYSKLEFDDAMAQYIQTIGHLEPSYVIQKFLDAQRIHNLTNYLENLHEKDLASKDHTTLLLNCYTKLKDVEKLNKFIKREDRVGEHKFDVETAIRVCRAAGYHEHAMYVAKRSGKHELYLKILVEDLGRFDEALDYISSLEPAQARITVNEYGKILVEHKPTETIDLLVKLCDHQGSPLDFVNIFVHTASALMIFLEKCYPDVKEIQFQIDINNILLELYLSNKLVFLTPHDDTTANGSMMKAGDDDGKDQAKRHRKGIQLLKKAWTSEMDQPLYDADLAVVLCEMNAFRDGLLFLYEKLKLYKEVISCYIQEGDRDGMINCCKRLGDSSKGGDSSLWVEVLKYLSDVDDDDDDCSREIKEVLTYIEKDDILPPIVVLQILARNHRLTLSVVKDYIARKLELESKLIEDDRQSIAKYQEETGAMKKEIEDLRTNARIFQISKCAYCGFTLDLPAVHFMCMHSFHLHCLGDNEQECPRCAPEYRSVLETRKNLEQNASDYENFSQKVKSSKDGFSVIADYFGKGIVSKAARIPSSGNAFSESIPR